ncbi:YkyA family protein [Halalkalibacter akibai]|uniref:YkyA family protein n=1 Tax=Halalkalibacter akibai TaxID=1411 RepID=UPI00130E48F6|nr:YkyA family protein [Halalkalibacter akibai]
MSIKRWAIAVFAIGILTGCGERPVETVYHHLEAAVELEIPFEKQQEPMQKAELKENEIFDQIISLGLSDFEEIVSLAEEAIISIESREAMIQKEKQSIDESYNEFLNIKEQVDKINKDELITMLQELEDSMNTRYSNYNELNELYVQTLTEDRTLFELLKKEELTLEDLQDQINIVNELYEKVESKKEDFNTSTDTYNQLKRQFYEMAELNVQYE